MVLDARHGGVADVVDMFTGKGLGRVAPPVAGTAFDWVAAAGDDHTFVLVDASPTASRFYLLRLAADGKPGPLTQLDVPALHRDQIYGMALTADASKLALAWQARIHLAQIIPSSPVGPANTFAW